MEDVIDAAKKAQAHEFINEMPLRYEIRPEENGANLSDRSADSGTYLDGLFRIDEDFLPNTTDNVPNSTDVLKRKKQMVK